jgi:hypothetical protein
MSRRGSYRSSRFQFKLCRVVNQKVIDAFVDADIISVMVESRLHPVPAQTYKSVILEQLKCEFHDSSL